MVIFKDLPYISAVNLANDPQAIITPFARDWTFTAFYPRKIPLYVEPHSGIAFINGPGKKNGRRFDRILPITLQPII